MSKDIPTPDRYARQRLLPEIGPAGQARLAAARVPVIGCGALGCAAADWLARAGVGWLRLVDRDLVEWSNLQRQTLFDEADAEEELPKAVAAARRLAKVNSAIRVEPIVRDVTAGNIREIAGSKVEQESEFAADLILDGTDNVATRYLINDYAVSLGIPWIYGACVGMSGRVLAVWPGRTACLRCVFPDPPDGRSLPTCDTAGVLGPAAGMVAAMQAAAAIRFLVEGPPGNGGGLVAMDVWSGKFTALKSAGRPREDCPCCGGRDFPFLSTTGADSTTLCGRNAVQVGTSKATMGLAAVAGKLQGAGAVSRSPYFVRCRLTEPDGIELTVFPDGRCIVRGTNDMSRAKAICARFVGS